MLSHKVWRHNDVLLYDVRKQIWKFGGLIFQHFWTPKIVLPRAQPTYKIYPIKFYREWPNLKAVKISFCKIAVPFVKIAIKDLKMTEKRQNKATLRIFSTL